MIKKIKKINKYIWETWIGFNQYLKITTKQIKNTDNLNCQNNPDQVLINTQL